MIELLKLIPLVILTLYHVIHIVNPDLRKYWWKALALVLSVGASWATARCLLKALDTDLLILALLVMFSFEMLQIFNVRMSLVFHLLFILIVLIVVGSACRYPGLVIINEYLLLLVYFLAESNQRYMKKTYEESAARYQNMVLSRQVSEVQNIYMTMRGWRHDYHNHLQTLKAHLMLNQSKEAKVYLDKLEMDLDKVNPLIETGNVNLDAILNSKLSLALKGNIEINYKAEVPTELTVSDIDLCVLIGNLIDNAVEACEKIESGDSGRFIRLYIGVLKKQLYITITNGTREIIRKLDEEYITAKRGNHGHGLKRINKIVEKYGGFINRKNEPGVFVTEILLPL
jgi:two-component system sensor histidine kinase AgrC